MKCKNKRQINIVWHFQSLGVLVCLQQYQEAGKLKPWFGLVSERPYKKDAGGGGGCSSYLSGV